MKENLLMEKRREKESKYNLMGANNRENLSMEKGMEEVFLYKQMGIIIKVYLRIIIG